jgi:hypothetical protein
MQGFLRQPSRAYDGLVPQACSRWNHESVGSRLGLILWHESAGCPQFGQPVYTLPGAWGFSIRSMCRSRLAGKRNQLGVGRDAFTKGENLGGVGSGPYAPHWHAR